MRSFIVLSTLLAITAAAPRPQMEPVTEVGGYCGQTPGTGMQTYISCAEGLVCDWRPDCVPENAGDPYRCTEQSCQVDPAAKQLKPAAKPSKHAAVNEICDKTVAESCDKGLTCIEWSMDGLFHCSDLSVPDTDNHNDILTR